MDTFTPFINIYHLTCTFRRHKYLLHVSLYGREIARAISLLHGHEPHNYNPIKAVPWESSPSPLVCVAVKTPHQESGASGASVLCSREIGGSAH